MSNELFVLFLFHSSSHLSYFAFYSYSVIIWSKCCWLAIAVSAKAACFCVTSTTRTQTITLARLEQIMWVFRSKFPIVCVKWSVSVVLSTMVFHSSVLCWFVLELVCFYAIDELKCFKLYLKYDQIYFARYFCFSVVFWTVFWCVSILDSLMSLVCIENQRRCCRRCKGAIASVGYRRTGTI